jgi:hypothetical protein
MKSPKVINIRESKPKAKREEPWGKVLAEAGIYPGKNGKVVITRWNPTSEPWQRSPIEQTVDNLEAAIRMQQHIEDNYIAQELPEIQQFLTEASLIESDLWNWKNLDEAERQRLIIRFDHLAKRFSSFRNEWKLSAGAIFYRAKTLRDSLGRKNPTSRAIMTRSAVTNLIHRKRGIDAIRIVIASRKLILQLEKNRSEVLLNQTAAELTVLVNNHPFFRRSGVTPKQKEDLINRLQQLATEVRTIRFQPYFDRSIKVANLILAGQKSVRKSEGNVAKDELNQAMSLIKSPITEG